MNSFKLKFKRVSKHFGLKAESELRSFFKFAFHVSIFLESFCELSNTTVSDVMLASGDVLFIRIQFLTVEFFFDRDLIPASY